MGDRPVSYSSSILLLVACLNPDSQMKYCSIFLIFLRNGPLIHFRCSKGGRGPKAEKGFVRFRGPAEEGPQVLFNQFHLFFTTLRLVVLLCLCFHLMYCWLLVTSQHSDWQRKDLCLLDSILYLVSNFSLPHNNSLHQACPGHIRSTKIPPENKKYKDR